MPIPENLTPVEASMANRIQITQELMALPPHEAVGIALAYLMHAAEHYPAMLRTTLLARIEHPTRPPTTIIRLLNRITYTA